MFIGLEQNVNALSALILIELTILFEIKRL